MEFSVGKISERSQNLKEGKLEVEFQYIKKKKMTKIIIIEIIMIKIQLKDKKRKKKKKKYPFWPHHITIQRRIHKRCQPFFESWYG